MKKTLFPLIFLALLSCKKTETCKKCMQYEVWTGSTTTRNDVDLGTKCGDDLTKTQAIKPVSGPGYQKYVRCN
jgi:hypothetical protein